MGVIKKGTIIVFTTREGTPIRSDLRGCKGELVRDFSPGRTVHVRMMEGAFRGREMSGDLKEEDFNLWIVNKGK